MTINEYCKKSQSVCADTLTDCVNFTYMSSGLIAEVGEVMGKIQKAKRENLLKINNDRIVWIGTENQYREFIHGLALEIGDALWFLAGFSAVFGLPLDDVAQMNIHKLSSREKRGKINGDGDYR